MLSKHTYTIFYLLFPSLSQVLLVMQFLHDQGLRPLPLVLEPQLPRWFGVGLSLGYVDSMSFQFCCCAFFYSSFDWLGISLSWIPQAHEIDVVVFFHVRKCYLYTRLIACPDRASSAILLFLCSNNVVEMSEVTLVVFLHP